MLRKLKVPLDEVIEAIKKCKDIIFQDDKIVGPTHPIWSEIENNLKGEISKKFLYTIVKCDRYDILNKLNIKLREHDSEQLIDDSNNSNTDNEYNGNDDIEKIDFKITLSKEEWNSLKSEKKYKEQNSQYLIRFYKVLNSGSWTDIVHSHFWEQTKIACSVTYKRAKIYESGINYCEFYGQCKSCQSELKGILQDKPSNNSRAIFQCTYSGHFRQCYDKTKRKTTLEKKQYYIEKLVNEKMSADMLRRTEGNNLMEFDDKEPSHLPTANALRIIECRTLKDQREEEDPILAICKMKYLHPYINIIKDIGYDRFYVHYWSAPEINVYRKYVKHNNISTICIDATGSLVKKPTLIFKKKTKNILLYEIAIHDKTIKAQYSVSHMLSEKYDNNSIYNWLIEWIRNGAPCPKQVVTDMSLALLAAVVRAFTQYNNLTNYISACFQLLFNMQQDPPTCFVRCDVAHIIKLVTTWKPLHLVDKRVKDFIVRTIAQMILSDDIDDIKQLLKCLFWLIYSKTDGHLINGHNL